MLKRILTIIMYILGIIVFFMLIFLIIYWLRSGDNRPKVLNDANSLIYIAQLKYYDDAMRDVSDGIRCYKITDLNYKNHGMEGKRASKYVGSVLINGTMGGKNIQIWLSDGESYASGLINNVKVEKSNKTAPSNCNLEN